MVKYLYFSIYTKIRIKLLIGSMAIITFMSDFGYSDHYIAAVKAKLLILDPSLQVIDISHHIEHFNISHGSYVLGAVFRDFPAGTVHMASVNTFSYYKEAFIALELENHFFVGADNGLFGMLSDQEPSLTVKIESKNYISSSFPAKDVFAPVAAKIATGTPLTELGVPYVDYKRMIGRKIRATKKQISGNIVRVDHYGNLITNIGKNVFDILSKNKKFNIVFGRESIEQVYRDYNNAEDGDIFAIFNSSGFLEIGINKGNASELLGLNFDSPVFINFMENSE
ncbi:SAM-dependent chlorinase/fluorinase [soil metagenome]